MAGFLSPLELEYLDGRQWRITQPFEYCLGRPESLERVIIPTGFVTDFASIPRMLWTLLPPTGAYGKAAVVHDWLYQKRLITTLWPTTDVPVRSRLCSRGEADHTLLEAMQVLGVTWPTRSTIYAGVRTGGWVTWNKYRSAEYDLIVP